MPSNSPTLWVVATPLGNPGDLSPRAAEILSGVDAVLCEDTRRSGLLFARLGLKTGRLLSCFEHNEEGRIPQVLRLLGEGKDLALVSDAGTPLMSDPGYRVVRACREAGFRVSPVPGPNAVAAALSACGLPPYPFVFLGFLPRTPADVVRLFHDYKKVSATLVFFERKNRLKSTLDTAFSVLGRREACLARELTKDHEEFIVFALGEHDAGLLDVLGEITVIVGPPREGARADEEEVRTVLGAEAAAGGKPREIARRAAARLPGWPVKDLYAILTGQDGQPSGADGATAD